MTGACPKHLPRSGNLIRRLVARLGAENVGLLLALLAVVILFGSLSPRFLSRATFESVAFQLPELGLLTLAMLMPIIAGGINLAVTFTANLSGLTLAWVLQANGGPDAGILAFLLGSLLAARRRDRERPGDGSGDRLYRRAPHSRLAFHDDLPARPGRIPDARRRHFGLPRIRPAARVTGA